ncbi:MAG: UDP-N-acetylglucosamine--N-acetylmuramyl-(pentapeptide) pyrophosphoryl-undecaprenol N-acetylglucosamine transferase [Firmicutes bacterium]|nr:UDP-N-acetylglucosamine--N-acetylmuramyl-(pentapeptide) pyrophosphoryl-undecaprenol N-acetylglucosamine transferase [Bacillota bacterium]
MKIVFTGGGTAGHVTPNLALMPYFDEPHYIGGDGIEKTLITKNYHQITTAKLRRSLSPKNLATPFRVMRGTREAKKLLREIKPDIVFSKGGFVAYPVVAAAGKLGIPVIIHESDMSMGLANRMSVKHADTILTTFEQTADELRKKYPNKKIIHTGAPIRPEVFRGDPTTIPHRGPRNLLVMGGSQGATAINTALVTALPNLDGYQILHITGRGKSTTITDDKYTQMEYMNNIPDALAWADIVVARAGSNTVCELLALGKSAVLIPYHAGRGDQIQNAEFARTHGAAILLQPDLTPETLITAIKSAPTITPVKSLNGRARIVEIITNYSTR